MKFAVNLRVRFSALAYEDKILGTEKKTPPSGIITWISKDGEHIGVKLGRQSIARAYPVKYFELEAKDYTEFLR